MITVIITHVPVQIQSRMGSVFKRMPQLRLLSIEFELTSELYESFDNPNLELRLRADLLRELLVRTTFPKLKQISLLCKSHLCEWKIDRFDLWSYILSYAVTQIVATF